MTAKLTLLQDRLKNQDNVIDSLCFGLQYSNTRNKILTDAIHNALMHMPVQIHEQAALTILQEALVKSVSVNGYNA